MLFRSGNQIRDIGAQKVAKALTRGSKLVSVNLYNTGIGVDGAIALGDAIGRNYYLKHLYLGSNNIEDEGAKALARGLMENDDLKILDLRSNQIGDEGAKALAEALIQEKTILDEFYLEGNNIGGEGATALAEAPIQERAIVNEFYIEGNKIGYDGKKTLAEAFERKQITNDLNYDLNFSRKTDGERAKGGGSGHSPAQNNPMLQQVSGRMSTIEEGDELLALRKEEDAKPDTSPRSDPEAETLLTKDKSVAR